MMAKPKRRWYRFRLTTLLIVVTLFTVAVWMGSKMHRAGMNRDRIAAVEEIETLGGRVTYEHDELRSQTWLEWLFDDPGDGNGNVTEVRLGYTSVFHYRKWKTYRDSGHTPLVYPPPEEVDDASLEHVKGLTHLESLSLIGTNVSDDGLEHLMELTNLEALDLTGTRVTDEGVKNLQQALPNCKINH